MEAKLNSIISGLSGRLSKKYYCRMVNGKTIICKMPERRPARGGTVKVNRRFAEAARMAKVLLGNADFRCQAEMQMRQWNAQFPANWQPALGKRARRTERHPYTTLYTFVVACLMNEE